MALKQRKKLAEQNKKARKQSPEGLLSKEKRAGKPWPLSLGANGSHPPSAEELNEEHEASERKLHSHGDPHTLQAVMWGEQSRYNANTTSNLMQQSK